MQGALTAQKLVFESLVASADLAAMLGDAHIYDDVPEKQKPPYITFGKILSRQWSTDNEPGLEHVLELQVWSNANGRKELVEITDLVMSALVDLSGSFAGHTLVNFEHIKTETQFDPSQNHFVAKMSFRMVTEPIT